MKRILTKWLAVLVSCLLVVGSLGFTCFADETEAVPSETTAETEQEQPEEEKDEENKDGDRDTDAQNGDPDSNLPPSDSSDETNDDGSATGETSSTEASGDAEEQGNAGSVNSAGDVTVEIPDEDGDTADSDEDADPADKDTDAEEVEEAPTYYFRTIEVANVDPVKSNPDFKPAKSLVTANSGVYRYQLTGNDKIAYEKIRNYIIDVANGRRTSTRFVVSFADLGLDNHEYTAEELGVSSIVVNGQISNEAANKMFQMAGFDIQEIVYRVLCDLPFDCYWYDKTAQVTSESYSIGATSRGSSVTLHYVGEGVVYYFPVATAYAGASAYTISTSGVQRALNASAKAQQIVDRYANLSDYGKLMKYRDEICNLVDYNHPAADDNTTPYGDPWNLVYVFDGDDDTMVVCEGYSKAFKYLCDLSDFENDVTCITVAGNFYTSNGTNGGHMWNIVYLGNGMNYMVDVTNCDNGSIGYYDNLMFKKYNTNPSSKIYTYKVSYVTIQYTYYDYMVGIYRDATLDLSDTAFVDAPAISMSYTCKGVDLNWSVVSGADHYEVYRRSASGSWTHIGSSVSTNYQDQNVTDGTYYYGIVGMTSNNKVINVYNDKYSVDFECHHTVVTDPAVEATYDHPGLTEGSHCSVCGKVIVEQQEIPQLVSEITITTQPSDYFGLVGTTAKFTVVAEGEGLTYQWQLKKGTSWANQSSGGATTPTFSVKVEESRNGKIYRCVISDSHGKEVATEPVTLIVKQPSITITEQPVDYSGIAGSTARFTVVAAGEGLSYQWQLKKGSSWANQNSGGAKTATFSVKAEESRNGKVYRCLITDVNGEQIATNPVTLTLREPSVVITSQPTDFSGTVGSIARFAVEAQGDGLTYQWQLKKGSSWANQSSGGATTSTFTVRADLSRNGKVYRCLITDSNGDQIVTVEVTLTVKEPSNAITIVSQPVSYEGPAGKKAVFKVVAEGEGLTYQWQLKKGNSWANQSSGGASTNTFTVKADTSRNGKVYRCVITDVNGEQKITDEVSITISDT